MGWQDQRVRFFVQIPRPQSKGSISSLPLDTKPSNTTTWRLRSSESGVVKGILSIERLVVHAGDSKNGWIIWREDIVDCLEIEEIHEDVCELECHC